MLETKEINIHEYAMQQAVPTFIHLSSVMQSNPNPFHIRDGTNPRKASAEHATVLEG
jgi:hypothetical protein